MSSSLKKREELLKKTEEKRRMNKDKEFISLSSLNINIHPEIYKEYKLSKGEYIPD